MAEYLIFNEPRIRASLQDYPDLKPLRKPRQTLEEIPYDPPKRPPRAKHSVDRRELQRREQQEAMKRLKTTLYSSVYQPSDLKAIRPLPQGQDIILQPASGRGTISIYRDGANHPSQDYAQHVAKDAIDILILADGVGGQGGGEIASHLLGDFVATKCGCRQHRSTHGSV
ncbi:MAG: hypothetical protein C1943_13410 [Halochromatium sp.]|nr:hypothetical protein [Halochromatium sp.]